MTMSDEASSPRDDRLRAELDLELSEVEASADVPENDEPEREAYETRLHSLHDAVVAVETTTAATAAGVEVTVDLAVVEVTVDVAAPEADGGGSAAGS
jgi:hypothetical protein